MFNIIIKIILWSCGASKHQNVFHLKTLVPTMSLQSLLLYIILFFCVIMQQISHAYLSWIPTSITLPTELSSPAYATINQQILYLFGGYLPNQNNQPSDKIYKYNINTNLWTILSISIPNSIPIYCYQCTAIINSTLIYIVTQNTNTILIFDTNTDSFISSSVINISTPLYPINGSYISVTNDTSGRFMYVLSYQYSQQHSIPHLQRFDTFTNQWLPSRPFPFVSHGFTASIFYNDIIFVFAGHTETCHDDGNDASDDAPNNCTITDHDRICGYNINVHIWECYGSTLNENKYGANVVIMNNMIYIIAGWTNSDKYSKSVDIFDPHQFQTKNITNLPNIGGLVITSILNGELYVFGGRNLSISSFERVYESWMLSNISGMFCWSKFDLYAFQIFANVFDETKTKCFFIIQHNK